VSPSQTAAMQMVPEQYKTVLTPQKSTHSQVKLLLDGERPSAKTTPKKPPTFTFTNESIVKEKHDV